MKPLAIAGLIVLVLGIGALAYQGVTYSTRETVLDIGPISATAERDKTIPLPPLVGIAGIAGGVAMLVMGLKRG